MKIEKVFDQVNRVFQNDKDIQITHNPCGQQFLLLVAHSVYISIAALCTEYEMALLSSDNKIQKVKELGFDPVKPVRHDEIICEIEKIKKFFVHRNMCNELLEK